MSERHCPNNIMFLSREEGLFKDPINQDDPLTLGQ